MYICIVKQTIEYYINHGSHVFACFVDFTKAFYRVNYWKRFNQLLSDKVDLNFVHLLVFWYTDQQGYVRWRNVVSDHFLNGLIVQNKVYYHLIYLLGICA